MHYNNAIMLLIKKSERTQMKSELRHMTTLMTVILQLMTGMINSTAPIMTRPSFFHHHHSI